MSKIMIVEDDPSIQKLLQMVTQAAGYAVQTASDGTEALDLVAQNQPGAMLLDLNIPGISGWEVAEKLSKTNPNLPIIVITGRYNSPEEVQKNVPGIRAAIIKPFSPDEVIMALQLVMREKSIQV